MTGGFDIAVVGSGAAGIAAAVSAARLGCSTLLLDRANAVGGTGGFSGLTAICGLFDDKGDFLNGGFAREFAGSIAEGEPIQMGRVWVLPYRPERFRDRAGELIGAASNITAIWETALADVGTQGERIVSLNGFSVSTVIDCSGHAEVARAIDHECMETDETTQAPAVIFSLLNVTRTFSTLPEAARVLLQTTRAGFAPMNFQDGFEPGTLVVKFSGEPDQVPAVVEFLRNEVEGFENCTTPNDEFRQVRRDGRMIVGRTVLTGKDVLEGRKFEDAVARCAWPIEQWGTDGMSRCRYLEPGQYYEIPSRALRSAQIENLFMAGKTISADVDAIASARVMGCCLATGEAAGNLAAAYLESASSK